MTTPVSSASDTWQHKVALIEKLVAEKRSDEAYELLSHIAELAPDTESYLRAARVYGRLDPVNGIEILNIVILKDLSCARAYFDRAILYSMIGKKELADQQYFAAVTFDPGLTDPEFAEKLAPKSRETHQSPGLAAQQSSMWRKLWLLCR
ncbi:MAG: hypothetical protein P1U89_11215 [Verrucomicrobiales bacterium]|nr:hypothetical protein [Verrucomicrobiales bacterium]